MLGLLAVLAGCPDDGDPAPVSGTTSTTGDESSSSSSSTADDSSSTSDSGPVDPSNADDSTTAAVEPPPPPMEWGDCKNYPAEATCLPGDVCVMLGQGAVCMRPDCNDSFDCPEMPRTGTAPVVCQGLGNAFDGNVCQLLCSGGQDCPDGMMCTMGVCMWGA